MSRCPNFSRTQFLGAGIVNYSAELGWGGQGGRGGRSSLQAEVVQDLCNGGGITYADNGWGAVGTAELDAFNPPELGKPVEFNFSTFRFGGLLKEWYEQDSVRGPNTYVIKLEDPSLILESAQLILAGYPGETWGTPNLYNIWGFWEEEGYLQVDAPYGPKGLPCQTDAGGISIFNADGFWQNGSILNPGTGYGFNSILRYEPAKGVGGAQDSGGMPWWQIKWALQQMITNNYAERRFGTYLLYNDEQYTLDISSLPDIDPLIKFPSDHYSLLDIITQVCELSQRDFWVELSAKNVIRIVAVDRTSYSNERKAIDVDEAVGTDIEERFNLGAIGANVGSATEVTRKKRGLELREANVNAFITGDFRRDLWQIPYMEGYAGIDWDATIWPYWGEDTIRTTGNNCEHVVGGQKVILGDGWSRRDFSTEHTFSFDVQDLCLPGLKTWTVSVTELRCALKGQTAWADYVYMTKPNAVDQIEFACEHLLTMMDDGGRPSFLNDAIRYGRTKAIDFLALNATQAERGEDLTLYEKIGALYRKIQNYAANFMGRKFLVKLPYLCKKYGGDGAAIHQLQANWDRSEAAWFEGAVLGMMPNSVELENFRDDQGLIEGVCYFSTGGVQGLMLDLSAVPEENFIQINPYEAYVRCTIEKIIYNMGENQDDPYLLLTNDSRAVVTLAGPVHLRNLNEPVPEPYLFTYVMHKHHGENRSKPGNIDSGTLDRVMKRIGMDKMWHDLPPLPQMPTAAAIPLQSKTLCYGPWTAAVRDDADPTGHTFFNTGKTVYKRDRSLVPWQYGKVSRMNDAGDAIAMSLLTSQFVYERGSLDYADTPAYSLGDILFAEGPTISRITTNFARSTGAVTSTLECLLYTSTFGKLATYYIAALQRIAKDAQHFRRDYMMRLLERWKERNIIARDFWGRKWDAQMKRLTASSSHNFLAGEYIDNQWYNSPYRVYRPEAVLGELKQILPTLEAKNNWEAKGGMELTGLVRAFGTKPLEDVTVDHGFPRFEWSNLRNECEYDQFVANEPAALQARTTLHYTQEMLPPVFCQGAEGNGWYADAPREPPITMETLSPFLPGEAVGGGGALSGQAQNWWTGHDIEYVVRDGFYPVHMNVMEGNRGDDPVWGNYSTTHDYRAIALKGPLVIAGWGYDTDNKPVPNKRPDYPIKKSNQFLPYWLKRPNTWKCGPVDLRWDDRRKVWTAPPGFAIMHAVACQTICAESCGNAIMTGPDTNRWDQDGRPMSYMYWCCGNHGGYAIRVHSPFRRPIMIGTHMTVAYDTRRERYYVIGYDDPLYVLTMVSTMLPDATKGVAVINWAISGDDCDSWAGCIDGCPTQKMVIVDNILKQGMCAGTRFIGYFAGAHGHTPTTTDPCCKDFCGWFTDDDIEYHFNILQGQFKPLDVVTCVDIQANDRSHSDSISCCTADDYFDSGSDCCDDTEQQLGTYPPDSCCYNECEIICDSIEDNWVEYEICVKVKKIWLQSGWSCESASVGDGRYQDPNCTAGFTFDCGQCSEAECEFEGVDS
jgi:hypothetical protein